MKDAGQGALRVNGQAFDVTADPGRRLSDVLREDLGLRGTKVGCDAGDCGACTVLLDGAPVCACLTPLGRALGHEVATVEGGVAAGLQASFLRHGAAQCGICTPGMLMAASALLIRNARPSRGEVEEALGGVLCRCTGYAKIVDAVLAAATPVPASPIAGAAVGTRVERLDGAPKVDGTESFGADHVPRDTLLVRAVRAPVFAAHFTFGDIQGWAARHDVRVFTAADIPGENRFSAIPAFADQPALARDRVRMRGEAVAIVAGEPDVVEQLDLTAFPVEWAEDTALRSPDAAEADDAPLLHADRAANILTRGLVRRGDAWSALADATHLAEVEVRTSFVEHAYIEPEAGVAWMEGDVLVIRACTQAPVMDRDETAKILAVPPDRLRIIPAATGGGFGSKLDVSLQPLIGLVTLRTGRPARMVYTRRESMASTTKRHPAHMRAQAATDAEGRITGMVFDGQFDTGAYASWGPTVAVRVPVHASGPYRVPHYEARSRAVHTNNPVAGAFRGFGVPQAAIAQETLFEDLALAAGIDPLAFRLQNALRDGDRSVCGQELWGVGIADCLAALKDPWAQALTEAAAANARGGRIRRGAGVASCWYGCGNTGLPNPSTIRAGITPDGRLRLHQGATDIGQGSNTVIAQIFADALGVALDRVELIGPDTALTPDCGKTSASRQTFVTGKAALNAGAALRARLLALANMGDDATLSFEDGAIVLREGGRTRTIMPAALSVGPLGYALSVEETYDPPTGPLDADGQGTPYAVYGYGAQVAEVAVDLDLGTVKVLRITAAHDVGRAINPLLAEGQIEGGIAQGLGMALMADYIPGRTENLHDYLIPTVGDMPEVRSILSEMPDPEGPFGAKGLGEHVLIPTAPAILNAIRHASGARLTQVPALPHRVRAAIREADS